MICLPYANNSFFLIRGPIRHLIHLLNDLMRLRERSAFFQPINQICFPLLFVRLAGEFLIHLVFTLVMHIFKNFVFPSPSDNILDQLFQRMLPAIICWDKITYPIFPQHLINFAFILCIAIVHTNRITPIGIDQLHAGNICIAVTNIDDISKRNLNFIWRIKVVDCRIIHVKDTLFDSKKKLCLIGIVNHLCGPNRNPILIIIKRTGINLFKLISNFASFNHFFQPG